MPPMPVKVQEPDRSAHAGFRGWVWNLHSNRLMKADPPGIAPQVRSARWLWVVPVMLVAGVGYYLLLGHLFLKEVDANAPPPTVAADVRSTDAGGPGGIRLTGTAGDVQPAAVSAAGVAAVPGAAVIQDIETITGTLDGHELVGRRVDVQVPVQKLANPVAFWAGPSGNRILVVL